MQAAPVELPVRRSNGSVAIVLPDELVTRLRVHHSMHVNARLTPDGVELLAVDAEFARQLAMAEGVMERDYGLLKRLAES